jgi:hypothetical protein
MGYAVPGEQQSPQPVVEQTKKNRNFLFQPADQKKIGLLLRELDGGGE